LKARAESVLPQLRQGIDVSARDFLLLLFDNVGFKILGHQASFNQWIMMNIIISVRRSSRWQDSTRLTGHATIKSCACQATVGRRSSKTSC
jgi:hypothetical protein